MSISQLLLFSQSNRKKKKHFKTNLSFQFKFFCQTFFLCHLHCYLTYPRNQLQDPQKFNSTIKWQAKFMVISRLRNICSHKWMNDKCGKLWDFELFRLCLSAAKHEADNNNEYCLTLNSSLLPGTVKMQHQHLFNNNNDE